MTAEYGIRVYEYVASLQEVFEEMCASQNDGLGGQAVIVFCHQTGAVKADRGRRAALTVSESFDPFGKHGLFLLYLLALTKNPFHG